MSAEMAAESMEIITMAVDKHQTTKNYEVGKTYDIVAVAVNVIDDNVITCRLATRF